MNQQLMLNIFLLSNAFAGFSNTMQILRTNTAWLGHMYKTALQVSVVPKKLNAWRAPQNIVRAIENRQSLLSAVIARQRTQVKTLLEQKIDIFKADAQGNNSFHYAAQGGDHETMRLLVFHASKNGLPVDIPNKDGWTPLMIAISQENYSQIGILLWYGSNMFSEFQAKLSGFDVARDHPQVLFFLKSHGYLNPEKLSKWGQNSLISQQFIKSSLEEAYAKVELANLFFGCIQRNQLSELISMIRNPEISCQYLLSMTNQESHTSLMHAVLYGYLDIVIFLVAAGADASFKNKHGQTALDIARECNDDIMVNFLDDFL